MQSVTKSHFSERREEYQIRAGVGSNESGREPRTWDPHHRGGRTKELLLTGDSRRLSQEVDDSLGGNNEGEQERFGGIIAGKLISSLIYCGKLNFLEVGQSWGDGGQSNPCCYKHFMDEYFHHFWSKVDKWSVCKFDTF